MTVEEAKTIMVNGRTESVQKILDIVFAKIEDKAKRGWSRLDISKELPQIFLDYDMPIISEVYGVLRENGFRINIMTHVVIWG